MAFRVVRWAAAVLFVLLCAAPLARGQTCVATNTRINTTLISCASTSAGAIQVISSFSFVGYGTSSCSGSSYVLGSCQSPYAFASVASLCLNKVSCTLNKATLYALGDPCPATSYANKQIVAVYTCGNGGSYYTTVAGCSPSSVGSAAACNMTNSCSNYTQQGSCVSSCSTGFTPRLTASGKMSCLSSSCALASSTDCSKCVQCTSSSTTGVASDGTCAPIPSINLTSSLFPSGSPCNNSIVVSTMDNNQQYLTFNYSYTAASQATYPNGSTPGIASVSCTDSETTGTIGKTVQLPEGISYLSCNATDTYGLSAVCYFGVQVLDLQPPRITCPSDHTEPTDAGEPYFTVGSVFSTSSITASDNVPIAPTVACNFPTTINANPLGTPLATLINCTATDASNNVNFCTFNIFVVDNQPPILSNCPNSYTAAEVIYTGQANVSWTAPTATDVVNSAIPVTCNQTGTMFSVGTTLVTCVAIDAWNNSANCSFPVTVTDTTPPYVTCPNSSVAYSKQLNSNEVSWTVPTSYDYGGIASSQITYFSSALCQSNTICTATSAVVVGGLANFTYTVVDNAGHISNCTWYIEILQEYPPVISGCTSVTVNTSLGLPTGYVPCPTVIATDSILPCNISVTPNMTAGVNCNTSVAIGSTTFSYVAQDPYQNYAYCTLSLTVLDNQPPIIANCPSSQTLSATNRLSTVAASWPAITATDNSGNVTTSYGIPVYSGKLNFSYDSAATSGQLFQAGTTTVTYTAVDPSGNTATCTFTITITDTQLPLITNCPSNSSYTYSYQNSTAPGQAYGYYATPTFNVSDPVPLDSQYTQYVGLLTQYPVGSTQVVFQVSDVLTNRGSCTFFVTIVDTEPPVISHCPSNATNNAVITGACDKGSSSGHVSWTTITATDNVPTGLLTFYTSPTGYAAGVALPFGTNKMQFEAEDAAGNIALCNFTVVILDLQPPTFTYCPSAVIAYTNSTTTTNGYVTWNTPTAIDNVALASINSSLSPGVYELGNYNVTVVATDTSGNKAYCNFTFQMLMNEGSSSGSSAANVGAIAGAAGAGGLVLLLIAVLVLVRRAQQHRLAVAQKGYAELLAMSDEYILERARNIQMTLLAQKQAIPPSAEAINKHPERLFKPPPSAYNELVVYILETLNKGLDRKLLTIGTELGKGEFGAVNEGNYANGMKDTKVAIKQLLSVAAEDSRVRFLKEAAIMAQFDHPNIVKLIGVSLTPAHEPILIVLEYMHLGSLQGYLQSSYIKDKLEQLTLLRMAIDVCAGMVYLSEAGFVHRDLAARNVLIDKEMTCRIGDFGLSIDLATAAHEDNGIYSGSEGARIPIRWTPVEAILYRHFSTASDVWSFGILMWEIWTYAEMPYKGWSNKKVTQMVQGGYRLPHPSGCPFDVYKLMIECWNKNPKGRIPFTRCSVALIEIWKELNAMGQGGIIYGQTSENDRRSMTDLGGELYDNNVQIDDSDDDEAGGVKESNLSKRTGKVGPGGSGPQIYDIGGADGDAVDVDDEPQGYEGTLYDVGGDEGGTVLSKPVHVATKADGLVADLLAGRANKRESLGLADAGITAQNLGDRVKVQGLGEGILTFVGPHHLDGEVRCGIELDEPIGESDGIFQDHRYFTCEAEHGVLVPPVLVQIAQESSTSPVKTAFPEEMDTITLQSTKTSHGYLNIAASDDENENE